MNKEELIEMWKKTGILDGLTSVSIPSEAQVVEVYKNSKTDNPISIEIPLHSIVLFVGPSSCGKSHLCREVIMPQIKSKYNDQIKVAHLSTDLIRQELLCDNEIHKYDHEMMKVSTQAFDLLFNKIKNHTQYPVNTDVVLVDTTGLDSKFRQDVINIAKENNYNVVCIMFEYRNRNDYYKNIDSGKYSYNMKQTVIRHVEKLRTQTIREISKKDFKSLFKIRQANFDNIEFSISEKDLDKRRKSILLGNPENYITIGDIHGCLDELKELLLKHEFEIDENNILTHRHNKKVILVGDYIDKGYDVKGVIEFIHANRNMFVLTLGNHENFVYKYLQGKLASFSVSEEMIDNYFDSIKILSDDEDLKIKFFNLVESSNEFYQNDYFIVTHAPCKNKYLGKVDEGSLKKQRNFMYAKERDFETKEEYIEKVYEDLKFIESESHFSHAYHLFGHVAALTAEKVYNKINLDSGCVYGNRLTSVVISDNRGPHFIGVSSADNVKIVKEEEKLFNIFNKRNFGNIDISQLDPKIRGRILYAADNKVNFMSGTVCPANKDSELHILENLDKALDYYKASGIEEVILETKYMGSRCNVYLFKDLEKCYSTSRNGYIIKVVDLTPVYESLLNREEIKKEFEENNLELMILDCELMPWSSLGRNLIDREFIGVEKSMRIENDFMKENGFYDAIDTLIKNYNDNNFAEESELASNKELKEKYSDIALRNFKQLKVYLPDYMSYDYTKEMLDIFAEQIVLYGSDEDVHIKPFSILKYVYLDGSEKLFFDERNEDIFKTISDDEYCVIRFDDPEYYKKAKEFYDKQTFTNKKEGIVVKPEKVYVPGVAPYMKVRNERYLTIIYGFDYKTENKYNKLIRKKNIGRKLKASINEFEIGKKLLEIKYHDIKKDNINYLSLYHEMIREESNGQFLDPRL